MAVIYNSILDTTKKLLGIAPDYTEFDTDIILHINSVFSRLQQLGVGDPDGFQIEDNTALWSSFLGENKLINNVKTLMVLQVRMYFDPPVTSFDLTAKQGQIDKLEWTINVAADKTYTPGSTTENGQSGAFMWELEAPNVFPPDAEEGDLGIFPADKTVWRKS